MFTPATREPLDDADTSLFWPKGTHSGGRPASEMPPIAVRGRPIGHSGLLAPSPARFMCMGVCTYARSPWAGCVVSVPDRSPTGGGRPRASLPSAQPSLDPTHWRWRRRSRRPRTRRGSTVDVAVDREPDEDPRLRYWGSAPASRQISDEAILPLAPRQILVVLLELRDQSVSLHPGQALHLHHGVSLWRPHAGHQDHVSSLHAKVAQSAIERRSAPPACGQRLQVQGHPDRGCHYQLKVLVYVRLLSLHPDYLDAFR